MHRDGLLMFAEIHRELCGVLPFLLDTVGEHFKQDRVRRPNGFGSHHFLWVKEGEGEFWVGEECFTLRAGEGVFFRARVPHCYEGNGLHTMFCTFCMPDETLDYMGVPEWMRFTAPANLEHETALLYRFAIGNSTVLSRSAAGYSYVMELFAAILSPKDSPAVRVLHFLEQHYGDPLTLDKIAAVADMDRFAFCRYYTKERGVSVMEDLLRIRIAKAKRFLKYGSDSVELLGKMCGFESASYFAKRFRETVGCTPVEYRKQNS